MSICTYVCMYVVECKGELDTVSSIYMRMVESSELRQSEISIFDGQLETQNIFNNIGLIEAVIFFSRIQF